MKNREIKFRGFQKSWVYGGFHQESDGRCLIIQDKASFEVDPKSVQQFTGLLDENGKEIYDGALVKLHYFTQELGESLGINEGENEIIGQICFQQLGLWVETEKEETSGYLLWINGLHDESYKIIGNIYENPALLTQLES